MDNGNGRLAIIACEILKPELEKLTEGWDDVVHKDYLEFALHIDAEKLKATVQDKVNALEGRVDAVFLGYAICQSLSGITNHLKVPTVMLEGDDCIAAILGPVEYARQKSLCGGTWFNTPGWALRGIDGAVKELHLDALVDQDYEPKYFLDMLFGVPFAATVFVRLQTQLIQVPLYAVFTKLLARRLSFLVPG